MRCVKPILSACLAAILLAAAPSPAAPLSGMAIALPPAAHLAPRRLTAGAGLRLEAPHYWLEFAAGPSVQDLDDAEPRLCYTIDTVTLAGRPAMVRITRPVPRLDCPERYLSLFLPARPGPAATRSMSTAPATVSTISSRCATSSRPSISEIRAGRTPGSSARYPCRR